MRKEIQKGSEEFEAFGDIFTLYKEIGGVEEAQGYWDDATEKINDFIATHNTTLGRCLAHAIMETLIEESNEQKYNRMIFCIGVEASKNSEVAMNLARETIKVIRGWKSDNI